ncbi:MAG: hypothetical protein ACR2FV_03360 [Ornithinimicrobium sp.]|uniref:hypothetical protein n=1 Tax=Ornithinimicrobium sp. TaxID=1977084 RepID=UPI003D9BD193
MELSAIDRTFLAAMAQDDGPSNMSELTARLQVSPDYASQYRLRLIAAGMIGAPTRGSVDFALPYLREYLRGTMPRRSGSEATRSRWCPCPRGADASSAAPSVIRNVRDSATFV